MIRRLFLVLTVFIVSISNAEARVDILPHLLVVESRERSTELNVLNLSQDLNRYELKIIHYRQDENGIYETLEEPLSPLFDPEQIVRMSPMEFRLGATDRQKVRVALRKPSDLPEGEYRFHLVATSYKVEDPNIRDVQDEVAIALKINLGVAIPVIVRHGDLSATGSLDSFNLLPANQTETGQPQLNFIARREGNASTLGRVEVAWAPEGEKFRDIGFITNFNLFTEIDYRNGSVPLDVFPSGGQLRILYKDEHNGTVYDEIVISP